MTGSTTGPAFWGQLRRAALPMLTLWLALLGWRGLVVEPRHFLGPAFTGGVVILVASAFARALRLRWPAVLAVQLTLALIVVNHNATNSSAVLSWIPTPGSLVQFMELVRDGVAALNHYYSPVGATIPEAQAPLLLGSLLLLILADLIAVGWQRPTHLGLPILAIWMVPISVLRGGLPVLVFVVTGVAFVAMLAQEETRRMLAWAERRSGPTFDSPDKLTSGRSGQVSASRIGAATIVLALFVPLLVPLAHTSLADLGRGDGGDGPGSQSRRVSIGNPIIDVRRNLVELTHTPLLRVVTSADPAYVRISVLDDFDGNSWRPSGRILPASAAADGQLPQAPGLAAGTLGADSLWKMRVLDDFRTAWLPTPYPVRRITVTGGHWRYDRRFLDIADASGNLSSGEVNYQLTAFAPEITAASLDSAGQPPASIRAPMTEVPADLPPVIQRTAERVTAGATSDYARSVALQEWFRNKGGFRYSLGQAPGSGKAALARFITDDRVGYCEQFAAAMATMARTIGIPSRVVVGFLRPQQVTADTYLFTSDDLHAWPEMYFAGTGWVRFEPTPSARTGTAPTYSTGDDASNATPLPSATSPSRAPNLLPAPQRSTTDKVGSRDAPLWPWLALGTVLLLGLVLPATARFMVRRRRLTKSQPTSAFAEGVWSELTATAIDLGVPWPSHRSLREVRRELLNWLRPRRPVVEQLDLLVDFVERARYARAFESDESAHEVVREAVLSLSAELSESVSRTRAVRARVFPRSLWTRDGVAVDAAAQAELSSVGQ